MCAGRESRTFPSILEQMISKTDQPIVKLLSSALWRPTLILAVSLLEEIEPGPRVQPLNPCQQQIQIQTLPARDIRPIAFARWLRSRRTTTESPRSPADPRSIRLAH